jgi:preprotein translocase subunit YajC
MVSSFSNDWQVMIVVIYYVFSYIQIREKKWRMMQMIDLFVQMQRRF